MGADGSSGASGASKSGAGSKSSRSKAKQPAAVDPAEAQQERIESLQRTVSDLQGQLLAATEEKAQLSRDLQAVRAELGTLRSKCNALEQLQQDVQQLQQQCAAATDGPSAWASNGLVMQDLQTDSAALKSQMAKMGVTSEEDAAAVRRTLERTAAAVMELETLTATVNNLKAESARLEQAQSALQRTTAQLQQWQQQHAQQHAEQQHHAEGVFVAHAPPDWTPDKVGDAVCTAANVSRSSVISVAPAWMPRPQRQQQQQPGAAAAAAAAGDGTAAAGNGVNGGGATASTGSSRASRPPLAVWKLKVSDPTLVPIMLGGRTRSNLRAKSLPVYVEKELTPEQRQQKKSLQSVRKQREAAGIRTRWDGAVLLEEVFDARGKRGTWQAVVLPGPPQQPGEGEGGAAATEEGEVTEAT